MRFYILALSACQTDRAIQAVANELGALCSNQQHLAGHAKHSGDCTNSLLRPFWRAEALLFASLKGAFGPVAAALRCAGKWSCSKIQKTYVVFHLQLY